MRSSFHSMHFVAHGVRTVAKVNVRVAGAVTMAKLIVQGPSHSPQRLWFVPLS